MFLSRFVLIMQNRIIDSSMRSASASVRAATSLDKHEQLLTSYLFDEFDHRTDEKRKKPRWTTVVDDEHQLIKSRSDRHRLDPDWIENDVILIRINNERPANSLEFCLTDMVKCLLEINRERSDSSFSSICTRRCLCSSKGQTEGRRADICSSIERNGPKILFFHRTIVRWSVRKRQILQRVRSSFALSMNRSYA